MAPRKRKPVQPPLGVPRYKWAAQVLEQRIEDGTYPPGTRAPTEQSLIDEFGYSRESVRAATRIVREKGMLIVTHGVGTFVAPKRQWKKTDNVNNHKVPEVDQ
jgi:DNA-binding GntR family transcriptional regulator